jgi:RNA polymerase sigma factor for flagellar operon FliA
VTLTAKIQDSDSYLDREELVRRHLPEVKRIVNRYAVHLPSHVDPEDLVSAGVIGLIQAADRYDTSRDNHFMTYASFRIKGAILSELRSRDYLGRSMRKRRREIEQAYAKLEQLNEGEVRDEDVANELGMDLEDFYQARAQASISLVSFEDLGYVSKDEQRDVANYLLVADQDDALKITGLKQLRDAIEKGIETLNEKEKLVVSMYYNEELTMKEIGKVLEITESRVSQIHSKAIAKLRRFLIRNNYIDSKNNF